MNDIFHFSPVPTVILSPSYRVRQVSQSLLDIWGFPSEQCSGRQLLQLLGQHGQLRRGADTDRLACDLAEAVTSRAIRRTDPFFPMRSRSTPSFSSTRAATSRPGTLEQNSAKDTHATKSLGNTFRSSTARTSGPGSRRRSWRFAGSMAASRTRVGSIARTGLDSGRMSLSPRL